MSKFLKKLTFAVLTVSTAFMMLPVQALASKATPTPYATGSTPDLEGVTQPVIDLIDNLLGPAIALVGALGAVYCVILGAKFAKAEEPQEREKAKAHLKNAIIGFVLIFVLMVILKGAIKPLTNWATGRK